jgi:hypothetical protein
MRQLGCFWRRECIGGQAEPAFQVEGVYYVSSVWDMVCNQTRTTSPLQNRQDDLIRERRSRLAAASGRHTNYTDAG